MLQIFKAALNGNRLEWNEDVPREVKAYESIKVIVTILEEETNAKNPRPFGLRKNEFVVPEDFDAALPEDVLADFEN